MKKAKGEKKVSVESDHEGHKDHRYLINLYLVLVIVRTIELSVLLDVFRHIMGQNVSLF